MVKFAFADSFPKVPKIIFHEITCKNRNGSSVLHLLVRGTWAKKYKAELP